MPTTQSATRPENAPVRKKGRERKRQILNAARARLIKSGIDGLVLREIAEELGITHGNLQYYFQTKSELLKAIYDEEVLKYTDSMQEAIRATSSKQGRLSAIIESSIDLVGTDETKIWRQMFGMADQNPDLASILKRANELYEDTLSKELKVISPKLSAARRKHISKIIRMMIDGFAITLIYEDPTSANTRAIKSEMKSFLQQMLDVT